MEFRDPFVKNKSNSSDFGTVTIRYACYRGKLLKPEWLDQDKCEFFVSFTSAMLV